MGLKRAESQWAVEKSEESVKVFFPKIEKSGEELQVCLLFSEIVP